MMPENAYLLPHVRGVAVSATDELRCLLDERGTHWWSGKDERDNQTDWESSGLTWEFEEGSSLTFLYALEQDVAPEQAVDATLGGERLTFLEEKVRLQGEYIEKLTAEKNAMFAQNCEAATRHAGQMDRMRRLIEEAELGRGECRNLSKYVNWFECSCCGWGYDFVTDPYSGPRYCPNCGRRVVEEV